MELQTSKSKREIEKSLYELVESTEKEARVPVARAVYRRIQLAYYDEDTEADSQTIPLVNVVLNANAVTNANIILNANAMQTQTRMLKTTPTLSTTSTQWAMDQLFL